MHIVRQAHMVTNAFFLFVFLLKDSQGSSQLVQDGVDLCKRPSYEQAFHIITSALFTGGFLPAGDILDIGANSGDLSCFYGCLLPDRIVHAVDPNPVLVRKLSCPSQNVKGHVYAMSDEPGYLQWRPRRRGSTYVGNLDRVMASHGNVEVITLNEFFVRQNSTPGFMHLDVEGYEYKLIMGGERLLRRTQPIFSFEVNLHSSEAALLAFKVESLGYALYLVNEICGAVPAYRNIFAFPKTKVANILKTQTLQLALVSNTLLLVHSKDMASLQSIGERKPLPRFAQDM